MFQGTDFEVREIDAKLAVAGQTLDPHDWKGFRVQAHRMLDDMLEYIEHIRERPVWQPIPDKVRARFRAAVPFQPTDLSAVHQEFMQDVLPFAAGNVHPGFMGWVQGGGTPVGMLAEMLAAGLNANLGGRDHIPIEVERQIVRWVREIFGFPEGATGLFVTGTSMANLIATVIARDAALGFEVRQEGVSRVQKRLTAYASNAVHGCMDKAMDISGVGSDALRRITTDGRHRICLDALAETIARDRRAGCVPFLVVGTAGTTGTGAIDDLDGLADLCQRQKIWFHVDGAYGALTILAPELAPRLKGVKRADSLAFDFHKWGQVPYEAGFLLVRDRALHRKAFATSAAYLQRENRGLAAGSHWPCDYGPDLSRGFHALKTWFTLKVYGTEALGAAIALTCKLARHLEGRIAEEPELELMAPVELNIVCFRYRSGFNAERREEESDRINREIVIELQESGSVAPSSTVLDGKYCIRAAIVNHRTSRTEIDRLIEQTLALGRALKRSALPTQVVDQKHVEGQKMQKREDLQLAEKQQPAPVPDTVSLLFQKGRALEKTGRLEEAGAAYRELLQRDPAHRQALNELGNLLFARGKSLEARSFYEQAVEFHPADPMSLVNLGNLLMKANELPPARKLFERALQVDPNYRPAHGGMSFVLRDQGETEQAAVHRRVAFQDHCVVPAPYRGAQPPITILELVSTIGGNVRTQEFLNDRVFKRFLVATEFLNSTTALPPHDLVFNSIGDSDSAPVALAMARSVLEHTRAPMINHPAAVQATGRCLVAERLARVPNVITPKTAMLPREVLAAPDSEATLSGEGFTFPLLLRSPGFHGGEHFVKVEDPAGLVPALADLPGDQVLVIQYLDARGRDGKTRKYRVMMVDGKLYPLHVAISQTWKIHYFSAEMAENAEHRTEDAAFLNDMAGVLGPRAMAAFKQIQSQLGLDYGGVDFGLNANGEILLFEANATMAVIVPDKGEQWDYRRPAVETIYKAVWTMLIDRAAPAVNREMRRHTHGALLDSPLIAQHAAVC